MTTLTAPAVIDRLVTRGVLTREQLAPILGADGDAISLNRLELRLLGEGHISADRLRLLKSEISGLPPLRTHDPHVAEPVLAKDFAEMFGVICLRGYERRTAAIVEDRDDTLAHLAEQLGTTDFDRLVVDSQHFGELAQACYGNAEVASRQPVSDIYSVLTQGIKRGASDIHLSVGQPPVLRVDGSLVRLNTAGLDRQWMERAVLTVAGQEKADLAARTHNADVAYQFGQIRFRISVGSNDRGPTLALRVLPSKLRSMQDLALPPALRELVRLERGLVLVTGPTGSGKTTTLAALLAALCEQPRHIITLEDPIEYVLPRDRAAVVDQREIGASVQSFKSGLEQALRQDPDVILVGELRDEESIRTALLAAQTGHLVFGTTHTNSAAATIARLIEIYPESEQDEARNRLAYTLAAIVSQTLLPKATSTGRVAAYEILLVNDKVRPNLKTRDGQSKLAQTLETSTADGMQSMDRALAALVKAGTVREQDAELRAHDLRQFRNYLGA